MYKNKFILFLFALLILQAVHSLAQNKNDVINDNKKSVIIFKLPYHLINYDFRYKRQFFYDIESEIMLKKNLSLVNSVGFLPKISKGYFLSEFLFYNTSLNDVENGFAFQISTGIRKYLKNNNKFLFPQSYLTGFYISAGLGYIMANYRKTDNINFNIHFSNIYFQFGWQKNFKKINVDISPFKLSAIYAYYNKNNKRFIAYNFDPTISLGIKILTNKK